jgi:hypothetical protein
MSISTANSDQPAGTCFVVMGFGKKTDFETGRVLDLNQSYLNLITVASASAPPGSTGAAGAGSAVHSQMMQRVDEAQKKGDWPPKHPENRYWVMASVAEAYFGIGDATEGQRRLDEALSAVPQQWMGKTTRDQIGTKQLLADSPLKHLHPT